MNKIEKIVYDLLKNNPRLKIAVRNIYQMLFDVLPNKKNFSINAIEVQEGYFFGFHDVTPFSYNDKFILANKLTIPLRMPKNGDKLDVGYFPYNGKIGKYKNIGTSLAWNYHKGCRLQWLGKQKIIYNDLVNKKLVSRIFDIISEKEYIVEFPIDSVSKCGKYGTSFSYSRLQNLMPGYGYNIDDQSFINEKTPLGTGLFIVDLENGNRKMIVSLNQLSKLEKYDDDVLKANHYVTHSLFSNDSRYIAFLHRWINDEVLKRWSRLIVYDREDKRFFIAPTNDMVSHYVWNNKNQIIAYCRTENTDSHVLFTDPTFNNYKRIAYPQLNSDGHQSFSSDTSFITDTYPDKYRMAKIYHVDIKRNTAKLLINLNSPKKFQSKDAYHHWACDFHPRMNNKGDMLCFDSVHTGKRSLCIMKI